MTAITQEIPDIAKKDSWLLRFVHAGLQSIKNFFLGGITAIVALYPPTQCLTFLAMKLGFLKELTRENSISGLIENLRKSGFDKFDTEALLKAPAYLTEYARQYNTHFPSNPDLHLTVLSLKLSALWSCCIVAPLLEEGVFRGLIQGKILGWIEKKCKKGFSETSRVHFIGAALRIGIAAILFSIVHLSNSGVFADSYVSVQLVGSLILGIGLGIIKESSLGMWGAIGAHATYNLFVISSVILGS